MSTKAPEERLHWAVLSLAGQCDGAQSLDGVGFNKFDSSFGHDLAGIPYERWTFKQRYAIYKRLAKYHRQLELIQVPYVSIPEPKPAPVASTSNNVQEGTRTIAVDGTRLRVKFDYNPNIVQDIKNLIPKEHRDYDKENRQWFVDMVAGAKILGIAREYGFMFPDGLEAQIGAAQMVAQKRVEATTVKADVPEDMVIPGMAGELRSFQKVAVAYVTNVYNRKDKGCYIADDMGLGKTLEALAIAALNDFKHTLIVCPATLKFNWEEEIEKWFPGKTVQILEGRKTRPIFNSDFTIINYDILAAWQEVLSGKFDLMVCDEAHYLKERKSGRTKAAKFIAKTTPKILLLSGTPVKNGNLEWVAQLEIMEQLRNFGGWDGFTKRFCGRTMGRFGYEYTDTENEVLNKMLRAHCYIRRLKTEVLDLPPKVRTIIHLDIDNKKEYRRAVEEFLDWLRETEGDEAARRAMMAQALVQMTKLQRVAARGIMAEFSDWVKDVTMTQGQKLIVFGWHNEMINELADKFNAPKITGQESPKQKQAAKEKFMNDPSCKLLVCNIQAGGVGLTLTVASQVAFFQYAWTPPDMEQAEDRIYRIGQEAPMVNSWWFVAKNTFQEQMVRVLQSKRATISGSTDGKSATFEMVEAMIDQFEREEAA